MPANGEGFYGVFFSYYGLLSTRNEDHAPVLSWPSRQETERKEEGRAACACVAFLLCSFGVRRAPVVHFLFCSFLCALGLGAPCHLAVGALFFLWVALRQPSAVVTACGLSIKYGYRRTWARGFGFVRT